MAAHNEFGKRGEDLAVNYLLSKSYTIHQRNWRCGHKELDIVAEKDGVLVIVEVKSRRNTEFGLPEDAMTYKKIRRIINSTDAYLRKYAIDLPVRFDLITVTGEHDSQINHIQDAFHPSLF